MSYILEALKKSELERGQGGAPGIQTIHSSALEYRVNRKPLWPWLLVAVLSVNLLVLVYFIFSRPEGNAAKPERPMPTATAPVAPVATLKPQQQQKVALVTEPSPPLAKVVAAPVVATAAPVQAVVIPAEPVKAKVTVLEVDELPPEIGRHIPRMEFSAHVFSSNPLQRSVVINGMFLEEGEPLSSDLILSEITQDGAIFDFRGYRFHRSVLAGWD